MLYQNHKFGIDDMIVLRYITFTCMVLSGRNFFPISKYFLVVLYQAVNSLTCHVCSPCEEPFSPNPNQTAIRPDNSGYFCAVSQGIF